MSTPNLPTPEPTTLHAILADYPSAYQFVLACANLTPVVGNGTEDGKPYLILAVPDQKRTFTVRNTDEGFSVKVVEAE